MSTLLLAFVNLNLDSIIKMTTMNENEMIFLERHEGSIDIAEPSGKYKIEISATKPAAQWRVKYKGHPQPKLEWYDNLGRVIPSLNRTGTTDKYEVITYADVTTLRIKYLELKDSGFYTLKAFNGVLETEKKFELVVKGWLTFLN